MRLFWTPEAIDDRRSIYDYIEADNPGAALALDELFSVNANRLIDHPGLGRIGRVAGTREWVAHRNYILIYDTADDQVRILRVLHAARQWPPVSTYPLTESQPRSRPHPLKKTNPFRRGPRETRAEYAPACRLYAYSV